MINEYDKNDNNKFSLLWIKLNLNDADRWSSVSFTHSYIV